MEWEPVAVYRKVEHPRIPRIITRWWINPQIKRDREGDRHIAAEEKMCQ